MIKFAGSDDALSRIFAAPFFRDALFSHGVILLAGNKKG